MPACAVPKKPWKGGNNVDIVSLFPRTFCFLETTNASEIFQEQFAFITSFTQNKQFSRLRESLSVFQCRFSTIGVDSLKTGYERKQTVAIVY